jgi:Zn-dependent peptidase ImmA (M78 family)
MPLTGNAWQRALQAADSAGRLLEELSIDPTRQVDVFSICEEVGLWLAFLPMDGLLGAFVPEGAGGVMITNRRPITVQRYTAAHELGHWRLERPHGRALALALDGEEHIFGASSLERERLAQVFAASLLMPPPLVLSLLARVGIGEHGPVEPRDAYFVAREAGVSYEAAVRQLTNLEVITASDAKGLLAIRPLAVKRELTGGVGPVNGYADVWPVDEAWNGQMVALRADDEIIISLPENRSTGYRWMFDEQIVEFAPAPEPPLLTPLTTDIEFGEVHRFLQAAQAARPGRAPGPALDRARSVQADPAAGANIYPLLSGGLAVVGDKYVPGRRSGLRPREARRARLGVAAGQLASAASTPPTPANQEAIERSRSESEVWVASTGRRLLGIRFVEPGPKTVRLQHRTPYSRSSPVEEYVLHAVVEPHRLTFSIDQLVDEPEEGWVSLVRERQIGQLAGHIRAAEPD